MEIKDLMDVIQIAIVPLIGYFFKLILSQNEKIDKINEKIENINVNMQKDFITKDEVKNLIELHRGFLKNTKDGSDK